MVKTHDKTLPKVQHPEQVLKEIHSFEGNIAERVTNFSGSMSFVYFHAFWFAFWIIVNQGWVKGVIPPFDPFPYGLLTMIVSLEAIFLSTFILIAQNRQELVDTYRELEEEREELEEDKREEELDKDVDELQKDMDDVQEDLDKIMKSLTTIQQRLTTEKTKRSGNGSSTPTAS